MAGKLYVVATPIGNLGDFSPRARETLAEVDFIAAEDTRVGAKLLNKFDIKKPQISYYEHNRRAKGEYIAERIAAGENCAIITDAGTPAISDPGTDLVDICIERGIQCVAVPGPSAVIAALSISGMDTGRWCFEGFLSTANKSRMEHLQAVKDEKRTMVFYEAPHKLLRTLRDMLAVFGDRQVALCREITKLHEECRRTTLAAALEWYTENPPKGECVLVIAGAPDKPAEELTIDQLLEEVKARMEQGERMKEAVKNVAALRNVSKNDLYNAALSLKD